MKYRTVVPWLSLVAVPASVLVSGCEEYYDVDAACHDKVAGSASLDAIELDAMLRINCYRRLSGLTRGTANPQLQDAADKEVAYVEQNPNLLQLISDTGPTWWLTQQFENPGFTGAYLTERLDNSAYTIVDIAGTGFWEFIYIDAQKDEADLKGGAAAIDELMRYPLFRQAALQPSWLDGAYAEGDLPEKWWTEDVAVGTETTQVVEEEAPVGKVYYMVVLYQAPHFEHVDKPVLLPKEDQTNVPLYSWSSNRNVVEGGSYQRTQISYPITFGMGSIDPANYAPIDQNQYGATVTNASIVGPDGPLETEVVHPGDDAEDSWPSGRFQRTTLAIFTRTPFTPSTSYKLYADLETKEGTFQVDYSFRTVAEDPGYDPNIGLTPTATGSETSLARTAHRRLPYFEPGGLNMPLGALETPTLPNPHP